MSTAYVVPEQDRSPHLKGFLEDVSQTIVRIKSSHPDLVPENPYPFLYLVSPWIVDPSNVTQKTFMEDRRKAFEKAGFKGSDFSERLRGILAGDKHLRECCVGLIEIARCLDISYILTAVHVMSSDPMKFDQERHFKEFASNIYESGRFKAISLCHLFNFQSEDPSIRFGDVRAERLDGPTISKILGESSPASFIHPSGTGEYFLVSEQEGACDNHINWLLEQKNKADLFLHVLQYFKDGVVHIDYAVPYFLPDWVNQVRKWGIYFIGNPRRIPYQNGQKPYRVLKEEREQIARWWKIYQDPQIFARISDLQHPMRQAGLRAAQYYEMSHTQEKPVDRLISLAIALEALFSPRDKIELTFRISQNLSQLIGATEASRLETFKQIKNFYKRRSSLVHGEYDIRDFLAGKFVTHDECDRWASPIRQAILRFLVLYLRGQNSREELLNDLSEGALDAGKAAALRVRSDIDTFLAEH